jgi:hypothetical protein
MRGVSRSSRFVVRAAMDAVVPQDVRQGRVRSSRVVLSPRRWGQVRKDPISALRPKRRDLRTTVTKKPDTPGRARSSRKTIAQGVPDVSAQPDYLCALLLFSTQGCGCGQRPAFPAPSFSRGTTKMQSSDAIALRECECSSLRGATCPPEPEGRRRKRRSNPDYLRNGILDCFASLAMTKWLFDS